MRQRKGWGIGHDVGKATEGLENELCRRWRDVKIEEWAELIDIEIEIYSRAHSPTFPSLHLRRNSFSNPSVASLTSQFILQPFFRFSYVTNYSVNSPGEPPMSQACNMIPGKSSHDIIVPHDISYHCKGQPSLKSYKHSIRTFSKDSFCRHLWSRCPWNSMHDLKKDV